MLRYSNVSSLSKTLITVLLLEDTLEVSIKTSTNSGDLLKAFRLVLTLQGAGPCSSQRTTVLYPQSSSGLCPHQFWDERRTSAQMRLRKKGISKLQIYLSLPLGLGQLKNKSVCL